MTAPVIDDCSGLWRRILLIGADGSRDASDGVLWLQGSTAYVDSRGFAGRLERRGDVFEWHRDVDLEPPGQFPDVGSMHWDGDVLVEMGVHEDYQEHWVRDEASTLPRGALSLRAADGGAGLLLRVGDLFGWVGSGSVVVGEVGGSQWQALAVEISDDECRVAGVGWTVERREGNMKQ